MVSLERRTGNLQICFNELYEKHIVYREAEWNQAKSRVQRRVQHVKSFLGCSANEDLKRKYLKHDRGVSLKGTVEPV